MAHRDYGHRAVVDKLGIKPGQAVALESADWPLDAMLQKQVLERTGRPAASDAEAVDLALVALDAQSDAVATLTRWRARLQPAGGIWLLTPKRGQPGYVDQRLLIEAGHLAGVVDNKTCSVSDTVSAMRFVIRKVDR